jgi:hypothetical protein
MRTFSYLCLLLLAPITLTAESRAAESGAAEPPAEKPPVVEEGFVSLFDGKTLAGWEGDPGTFRVENAAILAGSLQSPIPRNEFLCTKRRYDNFELRFEAKLVGPGKNAGVQFRSERIPNHHEVTGYQCDIGVMDGKSIWGSLYDESRRNKFLVQGDHDKIMTKFKPDDWNILVVRCEGPRIRIWVNDVATVDYTETEPNIAKTGIIGLQIHGGAPAVASYRHLRIRELR